MKLLYNKYFNSLYPLTYQRAKKATDKQVSWLCRKLIKSEDMIRELSQKGGKLEPPVVGGLETKPLPVIEKLNFGTKLENLNKYDYRVINTVLYAHRFKILDSL